MSGCTRFVVEEAEAGAFLPRSSMRRIEVRGESRDKLFVSGEMGGELVANRGAFKLEDNLFVSFRAAHRPMSPDSSSPR